ncbi:DUF2835 family protein [Veronia pacifica]|uniref:DUF2835 domain-containing protein n=1 Tax=Veronia pacifica TaxID=1080227 RepID=A0A1C3ERK2_9GAMM|nr:DUF2835 family protein [Veronia pacifica]ODA35882.1 hypothetical protein A8L45_02280 [Veronia pacifica]
MSSRTFTFSVDIPYQNFLDYYKGIASTVVVTADSGESMELDASHFRDFVSPHGVRGRFRLVLGDGNRFESLEMIDEF